MAQRQKTGMVLGKFLPLHKGHELLLRFAQGFVDRLYVVVDWHEAIDGEKRCRWVRETAPGAEVFYLPAPHPQAPEDHPDFWSIWRESLLSLLPQRPDYVIASENYGFRLAEVLGAAFIPFDLQRENISVCATDIRGGLFEKWDYLSAAAQRDYLARICIFGPESAGKSTMARQLADHFRTVHVPEYARFFIETRGDPKPEDMLHIAQGQAALEDALAPAANRYLFCDTDPMATTIWSQWLFNDCPRALSALARERNYRHYLLMDADLPWQKDRVRYFEGRGKDFLAACVETLEKYDRPYTVIGGQGAARLDNALAALAALRDDHFRV